MTSEDTGSLTILNVGAGDIELRFNPHQPDELQRAITMLLDMQRRGYAILVRQSDGSYARAISIDATRGLYIIAGDPVPLLIAEGEILPTEDRVVEGPVTEEPPRRRGRPKGAKAKRTQPIETSEAVGVGRTAGG